MRQQWKGGGKKQVSTHTQKKDVLIQSESEADRRVSIFTDSHL